MEEFGQIVAKALQGLELFWCRFHDLRFCLKNGATFPLHQQTHDFAHAPARSAQYLKSIAAGYKQRYAVVANNAYTFRETIEGLKFKSGEINLLELLGGIHEEFGNWVIV